MVYDKMWVDKNTPPDGRDSQAKQAAHLMFVVSSMNKFTLKIKDQFVWHSWIWTIHPTKSPNSTRTLPTRWAKPPSFAMPTAARIRQMCVFQTKKLILSGTTKGLVFLSFMSYELCL
jgi:hypothetical protein